MTGIEYIVKESYSLTEVLRKQSRVINSRNLKKLKQELVDSGVPFGHFTPNGTKPPILLQKICPVCDTKFYVKAKGRTANQVTCSHGCSNTYFNKQKDLSNHRTICFRYHEKKCVCCEERKIIAVHHYNHNDGDNTPSNLIPLCPTHHQYWHSRYRNEVKPTIDKYKQEFEQKQLTEIKKSDIVIGS